MTEMVPAPITGPALAAYDVVVAHQGWDELVLFGVPVVLAILAVRWAERRGKMRRDDELTEDLTADDVPDRGGAEDDGPHGDVAAPPAGAGPTDPGPAAP